MQKWIINILDWYRLNKRDLPWRKTQDPYGIWISEIMLQQTRVETVIDYYLRFMKAFPTVHVLAHAELDEVLKLWEGLGYYSRAKNIHRASKIIDDDYSGIFPDTYEEVIKLPGIGPYTVGAILGIAFNKPLPAVDGNVLRVMSRILLIEEDIQNAKVQQKIREALLKEFPEENASDFNQSLMELGALICIPKTPKCLACPVSEQCSAFQEQRQNELPIKKKKTAPKKMHRIIAYIEQGGRILVSKREEEGLLGGLWEFPGVETNEEERVPVLFESRYGMKVKQIKHLFKVKHVFTHVLWEMSVIQCDLCEGEGVSVLQKNLKWVTTHELQQLTIPTAFKKIKDYALGNEETQLKL